MYITIHTKPIPQILIPIGVEVDGRVGLRVIGIETFDEGFVATVKITGCFVWGLPWWASFQGFPWCGGNKTQH